MFEVVLTNRALRDIKKIDREIAKFILGKLEEYSHNPFQHAKKLTDPKLGTYKFRVGDYRIIFDIDGSDLIVLRVGHRKDIYR
jgi:mRNA interferase RelE/StbE